MRVAPLAFVFALIACDQGIVVFSDPDALVDSRPADVDTNEVDTASDVPPDVDTASDVPPDVDTASDVPPDVDTASDVPPEVDTASDLGPDTSDETLGPEAEGGPSD